LALIPLLFTALDARLASPVAKSALEQLLWKIAYLHPTPGL
jgi:hypothetical protein